MFWRVSFEAGSEIQKQFNYRHMSATDDPSFSPRLSVALSGYPKAHGLRMHNYINCIMALTLKELPFQLSDLSSFLGT